MLHQSYLDTAEDSRDVTRSREQDAFSRTLAAMEASEADPGNSSLRTTAIFEVNRLWSFLLEDLASPKNGFPIELRAQLISIGIYILRRCEALRDDPSQGFAGLIEISRNIQRGLG